MFIFNYCYCHVIHVIVITLFFLFVLLVVSSAEGTINYTQFMIHYHHWSLQSNFFYLYTHTTFKTLSSEDWQSLKCVPYIFLCICYYNCALFCENLFLIHVNGIVLYITLFLSQCFYDLSMSLCITTNQWLLIIA